MLVAIRMVEITVAMLMLAGPLSADDDEPIASFVEVQRFKASEARQGVAVNAEHIFAITNSAIGQYDKRTGQRKRQWIADEEWPLVHLNAGIVRDGKLFCAHSNYPHFPESSSVEIWDAETLEHIGSQSFGIYEGSLTWVDWHDGSWWAVFAHYSKQVNGNPRTKDNRWTSLVKFDKQWRRQAAWVFPQEVLERFHPDSCSGGGWGPDGALYCTGHDHGELYRLTLPKAGSTLVLTDIIDVPFTGQGIAWDPDGKHLYGIHRPNQQIIVCRVRN